MRVLLVHPEFPRTYWGFQYSLPFIDKQATLPPLGLVSVAALLPRAWELRLVDMNVATLDDDDLRWADVVLVGGMLVQAPSMNEVLARARALGRRTVVGGPACTTSPALFDAADHLFIGEAEGRTDELEAAALGLPGTPRVLRTTKPRPDLDAAPVPRFDLLDLARYRTMSVQASRGCPFSCEFCDIIEIFGRVPRMKAPAQLERELEALTNLGYRGEVFVVDDNFIGNRKAVRAGLEVMGGFIVGFDTDGPDAFRAQLELLRDTPIPLAMVGLMIALPETALWRRLAREGRLREPTDGDQFGRPNFDPRMDEDALLTGYSALLGALYAPGAYFDRCAALVDRIGMPAGSAGVRRDDLRIALGAVLRLGLLGARRRDFWRLVGRGLRRGLGPTKTAISCAIQGEHMIRYTEEDVLPRLASALVDVRRGAAARRAEHAAALPS